MKIKTTSKKGKIGQPPINLPAPSPESNHAPSGELATTTTRAKTLANSLGKRQGLFSKNVLKSGKQ